MMKTRVCELCNGEASLYCVSDSAFLCWNCDFRVHQANFLVARHVRLTVCSKCNEFDGNRRSGGGVRFNPLKPICCISCCSSSSEEKSESSSSLSSDCISTTETEDESLIKTVDRQSKVIKFYDFFDRNRENNEIVDSSETKKMKPENKTRSGSVKKAEGILVNWCRILGLGGNDTVLSVALKAFGVCLERFTVLPFRVALASSLWFSLSATCQSRVIRRVEEISGVPAKLIILGELKISRVLNLNRRSQDGVNQEEGWAECTE